MLRSLKSLEHYMMCATDGDLGKVLNFLIDDDRWTVRYMVADTGGFLEGGRRVLISPIFFRSAEWSSHRFHLALTREKVRASPSIDTDKSVSRKHEEDYYEYYGYPFYWGRPGIWGMDAYPAVLTSHSFRRYEKSIAAEGRAGQPGKPDTHLRSAREIRGYRVKGTDRALGDVVDFLVDDETSEVRYLFVETGNWWFGKKVLVSPSWVVLVDWAAQLVQVDLSRQAIKASPEWDPKAGINREYEAKLYDYYGRPGYWRRPAREKALQTQNHSGPHST